MQAPGVTAIKNMKIDEVMKKALDTKTSLHPIPLNGALIVFCI